MIKLYPSEDCAAQFVDALKKSSLDKNAKCFQLSPGKYIFRKKDAVELRMAASNTVSPEEDQVKHVGLLLDHISDLTIEGNGAELIFDGDMSAIAMLNCRNIILRNCSIDYIHPRVYEMRCVASHGRNAEFELHPDTRAMVQDGKLVFLNPDGIPEFAENLIVQCAAADGSSNLRSVFHPIAEAENCMECSHDRFCVTFRDSTDIEVGCIFQFRNPTRNENGIFLHECANVQLDHLNLYFTPGLGIIAQLCRDLDIQHHFHAPRPESGRACAAFADCIQISGCRGKLRIADCRFSGSQDDPINIHGTYLSVTKINGLSLTLEFSHSQTWGFLPFAPGDEVALVDAETLERLQYAHVLRAKLMDPGHIELVVDSAFPDDVERNSVIENLSACPEAFVENNHFSCYPTRGLLITTSAPSIVRGNTFVQAPPRPAILISSDACSWYESGGVRDLLIEHNRFENCSVPAIEINPNNQNKYPLHYGIRIKNNIFDHCTSPYLYRQGCVEPETDI